MQLHLRPHDPSLFAAHLAEKGIGQRAKVVAYDDVGGWIAARLWWMLDNLGHRDVAVLDGGIRAWTESGRDLSTAVATPLPTEPLDVPPAWTRVIERDDLLSSVRRQGDGLRERLETSFGAHPHIGDIRGRGLLMAIELVDDRASKRPFDPALRLHERIKAEAMARGLMVYPMGGTIDGRLGDHVLLAPPFIVTDVELDAIVERLASAVDAAVGSVQMVHAATSIATP